MPYYCTVPRCTSMAGKAKNVSFHQFPRDEQLARLWNDILKRGKPYTKYSKVCSLHFKPEDYTITSVGKNKGQWRTLRKDAVPSQNLPSETPAPYSRKQWESWSHNTPNVLDQPNYQQMAHAIYMQTMLAMQAAGTQDPPSHQNSPVPERPQTSHDLEMDTVSYKCTQCTKCFKDPDVFILHKRTHARDRTNGVEKENYNMNLTLRSNPILANLLKTNNEVNFDPKIVTVENLLMSALAANMDYIRNLSLPKEREDTERENDDSDRNSQDLDPTRGHCPKTLDESAESHQNDDLTHTNGDTSLHSDQNSPKNDPRCSKDDLNHIGDPNEGTHQSSNQLMYEMNFATKLEGHRSYRESYYTEYGEKNCENYVENSDKNVKLSEKSYDTDLNESMDSNGLVIDEGV